MMFVDSNIWCYYLDSRLPEHVHVREPMRGVIRGGEVAINTVVVMEVAHYLTRSLAEAGEKIESFVGLRNMRIVDLDRELMRASLEYLTRYAGSHGLGGRDSTILASMDRLGIDALLTHDRGLKAVAERLGIRVEDPIP